MSMPANGNYVVSLQKNFHAFHSFHHTPGIIVHLLAIAFLPNFLSYHSLLEAAVTDRFTATKMNAANMVVLIHASFGAEITARERYIKHSAE